LTILYNTERYIAYNCEKLLSEIILLLKEPKEKIRIKCIECAIAVSLKNNIETCKQFIVSRIDQE